MSTTERRIIAATVGYLAVSLLSGGWVYNHTAPKCWQIGDHQYCDETGRDLKALWAGPFWPLYWAVTASILVTRWP